MPGPTGTNKTFVFSKLPRRDISEGRRRSLQDGRADDGMNTANQREGRLEGRPDRAHHGLAHEEDPWERKTD